MIIIVVMVVNPTNTGTGTGTDKYDPKGPFNIGQDYINQTQPFRTYNTNNTNTFNEDPCGKQHKLERIWTQSCRLL